MMTDYENGYDIDYSPFFEHDIGLKAENISFDYTDEELEEIDRCYNDPKYFIERYCRWMTDHGDAAAIPEGAHRHSDVTGLRRGEGPARPEEPQHHMNGRAAIGKVFFSNNLYII